MVDTSRFATALVMVGFLLAATAPSAAADGLDLAPVADTFVQSGTEAAWDHGVADHLDVDQSPADLGYLRFDLSALGAPVARATLTLFCRDGGSAGGTVYPVGDSRWVEGTRHGETTASAAGPGLKWTDLDTNGNGTLDAADTSPYLPDRSRLLATLGPVVAGQSVTVDVTAAFQAGPGLYSLAIVGTSPNEASFASRESTVAAERPRLHVELGAVPVPPSITTTTTTAPPLTTTTTPPPPPAPRTDRGRFRIQPMTLHAASGLLQGQGENLTCYHKHGPSHPMEVGRIHISMPGDGGHHVILFRPHPGPVQWPPKNCPLTLNWDQWELIAQTQHPETDWQLPPGVAINISRRQPLLVQTHYVKGSHPKTRHAGEGIECRCHSQNNTDTTFTYGPDASTQEHCILFGAYYPTSTVQEAINCTRDKDASGHDVSTIAIVAGE